MSQNSESFSSTKSKMENVLYALRKLQTPAWIIHILKGLEDLDLSEEYYAELVTYLLLSQKIIVQDMESNKPGCLLFCENVLITWNKLIYRTYIRLNDQKTLCLKKHPTTNYINYMTVERSFQSILKAENLRKNLLKSMPNMPSLRSFTNEGTY